MSNRVTNSMKRNPAATSTASIGIVVLALAQTFKIELTTTQLEGLVIVLSLWPAFVNWLKSKWTWLAKFVESGQQ